MSFNEKLEEIETLVSMYSSDFNNSDIKIHLYSAESGYIKIKTYFTSINIVNANDDNFSCEINNLPPFKLEFFLPDEYPRLKSPVIIISCSWLNYQQIKQITSKLYLIWKLLKHNVTLYEWIQFISHDLISFLNITTLKLQSHDYNEVKQYDHQIKVLEFNKSKQLCDVCFTEDIGLQFALLENCNHSFCKNCLQKDFEIKIIDGSVSDLKCLAVKCDSKITISLIKEIVNNDCFKIYERLTLERCIDQMKDIRYCPIKICRYPVIVDLDSNIGICPMCNFAFCIQCMRATHGVEKCKFKIDEHRLILDKYDAADEFEKIQIVRKHGKKMIEEIKTIVLSDNWILQNCKPCPLCHTDIEKADGCNKMICHKCRSIFCWLCMETISRNNPYAHFSDKNKVCYNKLFYGVPEATPVNIHEDETNEAVDLANT